jgi:hypothetical protein
MLRSISQTQISIAITWNSTNCGERNSEIIGYNVTYFPTGISDDNVHHIKRIGSNDDSREYNATNLIPGTSYTFTVAALSSNHTGPDATLVRSTLTSEGMAANNKNHV